jgi:hypothetical protein
MSYKYIALSSFTANINGVHTEFKAGDTLVLSSRHLELDTYINSKDVIGDSYKKAGHVPYGMVVVEEIEDEKPEKPNKNNDK